MGNTAGQVDPVHVQELERKLLLPSPHNPRGAIDPQAPELAELVASIERHGIQIPLHVAPLPGSKAGQYVVLCGGRRLAAAKAAKLATVPAIVHVGMTEEEAWALTLSENIARQDLTPLEFSKAAAHTLEVYDGDATAAASTLGVSVRRLGLLIRLQELSPNWQASIADPQDPLCRYSSAHLELIARYPEDTQEAILQAAPGQQRYQDVPTVAEFESWLNEQYERQLSKAPWALACAELTEAPACNACPKRSSLQGLLFAPEDGEPAPQDRCLDAACWLAKTAAHLKATANALKQKHGAVALISTATRTNYQERQSIAKMLGSPVKDTWQYEKAKRSEDGARPALVVNGPGLGKLRWIAGKQSAEQEDGAPEVKQSKAQLHRALEDARARTFAEAVKDHVDNLQAVPVDEKGEPRLNLVLAASAAFLAYEPIVLQGDLNGGGMWKALAAFAAAGTTEILAALWPGVCASLAEAVPLGSYMEAEVSQASALGLCELLGIDPAPFHLAAVEKHPDPKAKAKSKATRSRIPAAKQEATT